MQQNSEESRSDHEAKNNRLTIRKYDEHACAEADPGVVGAVDHLDADHQDLQSGRHRIRRPAGHQRERRSGHRIRLYGDPPGVRLHVRSGRGEHPVARAGRKEERKSVDIRFGRILLIIHFRHTDHDIRIFVPGRYRDAPRQHENDRALCKNLYHLYPDRGAVHVLEPFDG